MPIDSATPQDQKRIRNVESLLLLGAGVLKAWVLLAIGFAAGYGVAAVVAPRLGLPLTLLTWEWLGSNGPLSVAGLFGIAGYVIELLRVQGQRQGGGLFQAWTAAWRLRFGLYSVLGVAALSVGVFAGLWWLPPN